MDGLEYGWPIIYLPFSVRSLCTCSIEPDFTDLAIIRQKFSQLPYEECIICRRITIAFSIPVPRRQIDTEFHSIFTTCLAKLPDNISFTIFPWRILHGIFCSLSLPQAETVMMLRCQDRHPEPCILEAFHPLTAVKCRRIEKFG